MLLSSMTIQEHEMEQTISTLTQAACTIETPRIIIKFL